MAAMRCPRVVERRVAEVAEATVHSRARTRGCGRFRSPGFTSAGARGLPSREVAALAAVESVDGDPSQAIEAGDPKAATVLVAGATGRTGERVVKELVGAGFRVKAGARDVSKASKLFQPIDPEGRVETTSFDIESKSSVGAAVDGADVVVCCVGAPENELNPSNPRRIDGEGVCRLVDAAVAAGTAKHFVLVSSLGTGKFGWPASVLNVFFGILDWKRKSEEHLIDSGIPFTIVRPGGMERPTDEYCDTHGTTLSPADTHFGGQVSRLQVAWVCRDAVLNRDVCENKVLEVIATEDHPKKGDFPLREAMEKVPGLGPVAMGSPAGFARKYKYEPTVRQNVLAALSFNGTAPELINGRLAMLGSAALLASEFTRGVPLAQQVGSGLSMLDILLLASAVTAASVVPLTKGATPRDAQVPGFSAAAEMLNGRLAMLGFGVMAGKELISGELSSDAVAAFLSGLPGIHLGWGALGLAGFATALFAATVGSSLLPFGNILPSKMDQGEGTARSK